MTRSAACCSVLLAAQGWAIERSEREGRRILKEAIEALGGERFLALRDRVATGWSGTRRGDVSRLLRTKFYTLYRDGLILERQAFDKRESHAMLFAADGAYEITYRGARRLPEEKTAAFRQDSRNDIFTILRSRMNEHGLIAEYVGGEVCERQAADVVEIYAEGEPVQRVWFSRVTHLPIRQAWRRRDPLTRDKIEFATLYSRYFDTGGVQTPRSVSRTRDGDLINEVFLESVAINQNLEESIFTPSR